MYRLRMAYRAERERTELLSSQFHCTSIQRKVRETNWDSMQLELEKEGLESKVLAEVDHSLAEALAEQKKREYERQLVFEKLNRVGKSHGTPGKSHGTPEILVILIITLSLWVGIY